MEHYRLELTSSTWTGDATGHTRLWRPYRATWDTERDATAAPRDLSGEWTRITTDGGTVRLTTDRLRSHHLLFAHVDGTWVVSDDPVRMRALIPSWRRDTEACEVFRHTGFTVGTRTLVRGVGATQAASTVELRPDGSWDQALWQDYCYTSPEVTRAEDFSERFSRAMDLVVGRLLERAGDRQLVVPLSGGLDSRLLAAWLVRLGAPRVVTFTYGKPGGREGVISRQVARALGLPWFSVDLDPARVARAWASPEGANFQELTWGLTSLPHVQDWYALRAIHRDTLVEHDAIFIPGHTIVGNTHDEDVLERDSAPTREEVLTLIARHHASLQGRPGSFRNLPLLRQEVVRAGRECSWPGPRAAQELIEWFNLRERQAKYINNSMKGYEAFDYGWALPMLDNEIWACWLSGSQELTSTRQWYADFTAQAFDSVVGTAPAGTTPELFTAPRTHLPPTPRRAALAVLRATGGDRLLSRYRSVRTMLNHPMAFEAFAVGLPRSTQALRMAAGATSLGLWADLFLANAWGADLVPPD